MFHVSSARICFLLDEVLAVTFQYPQRANLSYLKASDTIPSDTILVLRCETQAQLGLGLAAEFCDRRRKGVVPAFGFGFLCLVFLVQRKAQLLPHQKFSTT